MLACAVLIALVPVADAAGQEPAGSALTKGMKLVYASGGNEQAPWVVDSLDLAASWQNQKSCSYVRFGSRDMRRLCVSADTLFAWNEQQPRLVATRPVGARMTLRVATSAGGHALYETGDAEKVTVSGHTFDALPTTVTTYNAEGAIVRRLRERYVLALATALGGVFEVPDPARPGQWNVQQEFVLARIEK